MQRWQDPYRPRRLLRIDSGYPVDDTSPPYVEIVPHGYQDYVQAPPGVGFIPIEPQVGKVLPALTEAIADVGSSADRNTEALSEQIDHTGKVIAGARAGLAIGAILAVLLARAKPPVVVIVEHDTGR